MVPQLIMRVVLKDGKQREFLKKVMEVGGIPTLRELCQRVDVNYSTMKNYFSQVRLLPKELFERLGVISGLNWKVDLVDDNWGQVKGGKISRRL